RSRDKKKSKQRSVMRKMNTQQRWQQTPVRYAMLPSNRSTRTRKWERSKNAYCANTRRTRGYKELVRLSTRNRVFEHTTVKLRMRSAVVVKMNRDPSLNTIWRAFRSSCVSQINCSLNAVYPQLSKTDPTPR